MKKSWINVKQKSDLKPGDTLIYTDGTDTIGFQDARYISDDLENVINDGGNSIYSVKELFSCWDEVYVLRDDERSMKELADKIAGTLLKNITALADGKPLTKEELEKLIQNAIL